LLHGIEIRTQTSVHGENLLIDDGSNRKAVEAVRKCLPQFDVVPSFAFIVKAVDTIDGSAFVITTQDEKVFGILDLVCEQQTNCFERLLSSIYIVSEKQVVCLWWKSTILEQSK
jgi:hypothetical protein